MQEVRASLCQAEGLQENCACSNGNRTMHTNLVLVC
jgi:hypothetical protein